MVGRRLREHGLHARTIQLKLRYTDFTTITRAHSLPAPTQLDTEIFEEIRKLFRGNWKSGAEVRLLGVQVSSFEEAQPPSWICSTMDATSAGSRPSPPPTSCATGSAKKVSASPEACEAPSASELTKIPRACLENQKSRPDETCEILDRMNVRVLPSRCIHHAAKADGSRAVSARRHQQIFLVCRQLVSLREIPDRS